MRMKDTHKIVLTGGPCAGKSTAMANIKRHFEEIGYKVFLVPEAATILINTGIHPANKDFQDCIYETIMNLENVTERMANNIDGKKLIICDRGILDGKAYTKKEAWHTLISEQGTDEITLKNRYDSVIHLCTAPKEFYTTENNAARSEGYEEAYTLDNKTKNAWLGAKLSVINNEGGFNDKINRVIGSISKTLGEPKLEIERKYIVSDFNESQLRSMGEYLKFDISQSYIKINELYEERVRKVVSESGSAYYHTIKEKRENSAERIETEQIISQHEYEALSKMRISSIDKTRYCFIYENHQFELDVFSDKTAVLEVELESADENVVLPPLSILREVTDDLSFRNANLSTKLSHFNNIGR